MKWIFYFMLLTNLLLTAWLVNTPQERAVAKSIPVKDVGDLKIVSDVELRVRADFQKTLEREMTDKRAAMQKKAESDAGIPALKNDESVFVQDAKKPVCRWLGPFKDKNDASNIGGGLAAYRLVTKLVKTTDVDTSGFWAVIPSPGSVEESKELVKKLKENGLVDIRRFLTGELENSISLGLFSSEANAIRRARSVEKLGFVAMVRPKSQETDFFWLEYMQEPGLKLPIKGVRINFPDVEIKPCPGIASD